MTRRDTIIAAVLVNAGLLIVLFASALKTGAPEQQIHVSSVDRVEPIKPRAMPKEGLSAPGDEVDQVLKQYAHLTPSVGSGGDSVLAQSPETHNKASSTPPRHFTEDTRVHALPPATLPQEKTPSLSVLPTTDYRVKKGDVLEKIARHHQCRVEEIMKLNHLSSTHLRIGQTLKIPSPSSPVTAIGKAPSPAGIPHDQSPKYYTVKNGDNPWTIAVKNHMKVEELLKLNNLDQEKARKLKPGDQLRIN